MGLHDKHLVGASTPVHFGREIDRVEYDPTGIAEALYDLRRGDSYHVQSYSPSPTPAQLARSKPIYPSPIDARERKYREVEKGVYPELFGSPHQKSSTAYLFGASHATQLRPYRPLWAVAEDVAGGAKSPYAAAVALERYFRVGGGFIYDQHPPRSVGVPPLVDFVTRTHRGSCQHLLGSDGADAPLPRDPRPGRGGLHQRPLRQGEPWWMVSDHDAHTWVEVWFRGWGWLPFDPTPSRSGLAGQYSSSSPRFDVAAAAAVLAGNRGSGSSAAASPTSSASAGRRVSRPTCPFWVPLRPGLGHRTTRGPGASCACSPLRWAGSRWS